MFEEIFKRKKPSFDKLTQFGFVKTKDRHRYTSEILDGEFILHVDVDERGGVDTTLIEKEFDEEYTLYKTASTGVYVAKIRQEIEDILRKVADTCFDGAVFQKRQSEMLIDHVSKTYGDTLEFLWEKYPECAIWRRKDNQKWYGLLVTLPKSKLGYESGELVEILDLRVQPEKMDELLAQKGFYKGWHMNKKHWYTVILDDSISDEELTCRLDLSYQLAKKSG